MTCGPRCLRLFWEGSAGPRGCLPGGMAAGKDSELGHAWVVWSMRGTAGLGRGGMMSLPHAALGWDDALDPGHDFSHVQSFITRMGRVSDAVIPPAPLDVKSWARGSAFVSQNNQHHKQEGEIPPRTPFASSQRRVPALPALPKLSSSQTLIPARLCHLPPHKSITTGERVNYNHRINAAVSKFTQLEQRFKNERTAPRNFH